MSIIGKLRKRDSRYKSTLPPIFEEQSTHIVGAFSYGEFYGLQQSQMETEERSSIKAS